MGDSLKASPDSIEGRGSSVECPEPTRGAHYHRSAGLRSGSIARSCAGTAGSETGAPPADAHVGGSVKMRRCRMRTNLPCFSGTKTIHCTHRFRIKLRRAHTTKGNL